MEPIESTEEIKNLVSDGISKSKKRTEQERTTLLLRKKVIGPQKYNEIEKKLKILLGPYFSTVSLRKVALNLCQSNNLHLDRNAKRYKEALICWFCENWDSFGNSIAQK